MNYGYMRVSTDKQDTENQKTAILEYGNSFDLNKIEFVSEIISSKKTDRVIFQLIERLVPGDNLVIYELSRLGRSMSELESIRVKIAEKKTTLHAISQNLIIPPDDSNLSARALVFALEISAQIERQMISDRTRNALYARKMRGLPMGRPSGKSKLDIHSKEIRSYLNKGLNLTAISKLLECNRQTLSNWINSQNNH